MKKDTGKQSLSEQLIKTPVIEVACNKAGIGRTTFYRWKKEDKEFSTAVDEALTEGCEFVSDIAETQLIQLIKQGNFSAVAYWLKAHRAQYGNKLEISGKITTEPELTSEQADMVRRGIILTRINPDQNDERTVREGS